MSKNRTEGRMIRKSISESQGFASLNEKAGVLFCMIIPHLNAYGKSNSGSGYIKDVVCPLISYLTIKNIPNLLKEISEKTNLKYFEHEGRKWLHSISFLDRHQNLPKDRIGQALLPSYSGVTPELVQSRVSSFTK
mgnify:CR=1 FL=1